MKNNRCTYFCLAWAVMATCSVAAQDRKLDTVGIVVTIDFKPAVVEAGKLSETPAIPDTTIPIPTMEYQVIPRQMNADFVPEPISAAKFKGEKVPRLYRAMIQGGVGNYTTPYAEFYLNTLRSRKHSAGLHLRHLSSATTLKNSGYSGFSQNGASLYGKRFLDKMTLHAGMDLDREVVHYYGFDPMDTLVSYYDVPIEKDDIRQRFTGMEVKAGAHSQKVDTGKLHIRSDASFCRFMDLFGIAENRGAFTAGIGRSFNTEYLDIDLATEYYHQALTADTSSAILLHLNPRISTQKKNLFFTLGVNLVLESDSLRQMSFFPDIQLGYHVIRNILTLYVRGHGYVRRNDLSALAHENPWVSAGSQDFVMKNRRDLNFTAGMRGSLSRHTAFHLTYNVANVDNMAFFVNDPGEVLRNKFLVLYDGTVVNTFRGEMTYDDQHKVRLGLSGEYASYQMNTLIKPWHKPAFTAALSARYNVQNKIIVGSDLYYVGKRSFATEYQTADIIGSSEDLDAYADLNLKIEYRYSKILSAFVSAQNLLAQRYMIWNKYSSQRLHFMAGFSYAFWGQ